MKSSGWKNKHYTIDINKIITLRIVILASNNDIVIAKKQSPVNEWLRGFYAEKEVIEPFYTKTCLISINTGNTKDYWKFLYLNYKLKT